jgi:hypothetical protein
MVQLIERQHVPQLFLGGIALRYTVWRVGEIFFVSNDENQSQQRTQSPTQMKDTKSLSFTRHVKYTSTIPTLP